MIFYLIHNDGGVIEQAFKKVEGLQSQEQLTNTEKVSVPEEETEEDVQDYVKSSQNETDE